jgi:predicted transposase YdaD
MATTDHPLKVLVQHFSRDFAEWLLDTEVLSAEPINVELASETLRVDTLLRVVQANGDLILLHLEFQGRRSNTPMPLRQLGYLSQLAILHGAAVKLHSVVLYTERYAGQDDTGLYRIEDGQGRATLEWRYSPLLLWQMSGAEIVQTGRPALLPLVSLTRPADLPAVLPEVVALVRQQTDAELRARLFNGLLALSSDEEMLKMIENFLASDEYEFESPYLRRWREKGRTEGLTEGLTRGRTEGLTQGRTAGQLEGMRQAVLTLTATRFDPPLSKARVLESYLDRVSDEAKLEALIVRLAVASDFDAVLADLPNGAKAAST